MKIVGRGSRLLALVSIAAMAGSALARQPDAFDVALENGDCNQAALELQKLIDQHRSRGSNAWLDPYYGRYMAAMKLYVAAEPYLVRAVAAAGRADRDDLSLELARVHEASGQIGKAEAEYRQLTAPAVDPATRSDAILALARLRLAAVPEEAVGLLTPLTASDVSPGARWEAHLLLSRAYAIEGHASDSKAALAAAWLEAPLGPRAAEAITATAMDMAIDRGASGDRAGEVGLVAIGQRDSSFAGAGQLPVCDDRLRPEDSVTVAIVGDARQRPLYSAVRASRPGIAQFFTTALAAAPQQIGRSALYVTLRCRSAISPTVRFAGGTVLTLPQWLAEKGAYSDLRPVDPTKGDMIAQFKASIQRLEAWQGPDSPGLVPALVQIAFMQAMQSRMGDAATLAEAKAAITRAQAILTKAGAPAEMIEQIRMQATLVFAQNQNLPDVAGPGALAIMDAMGARADTTPAQMLAMVDMTGGWRLRPVQKLALLDRVVSFFDARKIASEDPIRQTTELRRAAVLREIGTLSGMPQRIAATGIAADMCDNADRPPSVPPTAITLTSDDYPKDLLSHEIDGNSAIELTLDATGRPTSQRIIVSLPAGLFDAVTTERMKAVTFLPAQRDDKPVACRGYVQTIRWKMPYQGNFAAAFSEGFSSPDD